MTNEILELLIAFLGGVALVVFGNYKRTERNTLLFSGIRTDGVVFRIEQGIEQRGTMYYYPIVRYTTMEKEWITQKYTVGSTFSSYKEGDKVSIIYDSADNKKFIIDDTGTKLLGPVLMIVGCVLIIFTVVQYFFHPFVLQ